MKIMTGKVAIVTGAAGGIGSATVRAFIDQGAQVVLTDIDCRQGEALAAACGEAARFVGHDVTRRADWRNVVLETERFFGPVTVLFNNAGISGSGPLVHEVEEADYRRFIEVNQMSVFLGIQAVIPSMRKAGGGSIINTSSVAGLVGLAGCAPYVATKFAVTGMTKASAIDLGSYGIRVNSLHPGLIDTPMLQAMPQASRDAVKAFAGTLPAGRLGRPEDIAEMAAFLASDLSSFCTGAAFVADGGWTAL